MRHYLLVDDNKEFAENIAEILRDAGADVTVASGGAQALALLAGRRFDALVTDMHMPRMDGVRLLQEARASDPGLPAILVTAYTGDDDIALSRQEGLLAILPKPVPVDTLVRLLSEARRRGLVAIVEDDRALADNLSESLRGHGFSSVIATSVPETERLGPAVPFAALVDLRVTGGPVGEAMRRLAARFPGLPMLVITANEQDGIPVSALGVFVKPFRTQELLNRLQEIHARADA